MKASKETMEQNIEKKIEAPSEKSTLQKKIEYLRQKIINTRRTPIRIMEVCGTHTMEISRSGLRSLLPDRLCLLSGPGCPVCVTPREQIDHIISIAKKPDIITLTFGDMMKVPGSVSTLERQKATNCDIRVVYSPIDALTIAAANPDRTVVFLGIGFETTSPTIAATLIRAKSLNLKNLYVYPAFKLIPPAMKALLNDKRVKIDGFLCPGHVSSIIGSAAYESLVQKHKIPCVIGGFQAEDIVASLSMLLDQIESNQAKVEIQYLRAVSNEGNLRAKILMGKVFCSCDSNWRGIGKIPLSGLELNDDFAQFDIRKLYPFEHYETINQPDNCSCGDIMRGLLTPPECFLFGDSCHPSHPVGPCMVSSEGACSAYFKYGNRYGQ